MTNRLQDETSPYLLQHADNPVDWYPWGDEAFKQAKEDDKPILLSVGYSACHWCHVMAHESFEDEQTAAYMNEHFINVKVDREERPDVDDIYMQATQLFNRGHGGWPMTVFMTPDGKPFHAGTYYPKEPRFGMPSFLQIMQGVINAYHNKRDDVERSASEVSQVLNSNTLADVGGNKDDLSVHLLDRAAGRLTAQPDRKYGGLHGGKPKFPSPMALDYLLRFYAHTQDQKTLEIVTFTLRQMAEGGIYDQIGYGFHRYSVDEKWLVPHFEKMLYDNAQLARVYLHAYQVTHDAFFARITREILTYVEREMLDASGGFYSTQDADSEGEEGKFFVWTPQEFHDALDEVLAENIIHALMDYWDVTPGGNFEGKNILHPAGDLPAITQKYGLDVDAFPEYLETARQRLFEVREERVHPGLDDKMLAAWNGMMLAAFAEAARVLDDDRYRAIAHQNADFLMQDMSHADGWLYRTRKGDQSKLLGYLEDYANVIDGLLELYQTTFEPTRFEQARRLADYVLDHFTAGDGVGFYDTSDNHQELIARPRSFQDNATPSGNNLMAYNFVRLYAYTGEGKYEGAAVNILRHLAGAMEQYPSAFGVALTAADLLVRRPIEVAIIGQPDNAGAILYTLQKPFRPRVVVALAETNQGEKAVPELLAHRSQKNDQPTVYICQNFACQMPVNHADEVRDLLEKA